MQQKQLLFLTTSNLATNPRLVKEIDLAIAQQYPVVVVAFRFSNWSYSQNEELKTRYKEKIKLVEISAERKPVLPWLYSTIAERVCAILARLGMQNSIVLSQALQKRTVLLLSALKSLSVQPILIIAHNPGSFYPAMMFAKQNNVPYAVDLEDYHPGEYNDAEKRELMKRLMQQVLPNAAYVSAAAPLILEEVRLDCRNQLTNALTVPNYFPGSEFEQPKSVVEGPLRLVWFSQYVAEGRGLEPLLEVLPQFKESVELHLYGQPNEEFVRTHLTKYSSVHLHGPLLQTHLHQHLAKYDIGLAFEDGQANYNRNICLTNKLLAYFQAGLFVLATNTKAQQLFIQEHQQHGLITSLSKAELKNAIEQVLMHKVQIRKEKLDRYQQALTYNSQFALQPLAKIWQAITTS